MLNDILNDANWKILFIFFSLRFKMFNNSNQNVNQQDKLKPNRLSLPSNSNLSFDSQNDMYDKYRHLEYHQKVQNILSNNQIPSHQQFINPHINRITPTPSFNSFNTFNSFNFPSPVNQFTNNKTYLNSFNNSTIQNSTQTSQNINNQNDNLICFDTHDDLNVLDAFDPLRNIPNKQELERVSLHFFKHRLSNSTQIVYFQSKSF